MAGKDLSDKELKKLQAAHLKFREEVGPKIITASKIKDYARALDHRAEGGLEKEIADLVYKALWKAVTRCDGNNRSTIKSVDI